jgi:hypothetical protein
MILDELLEKRGLKFEDLQGEEKQQYISWLNVLEERPLSADDIKTHVRVMREAVENELVDTEEFVTHWFAKIPNRKHVLLKARLKNYLLIESMLQARENSKKQLEKQLQNLVNIKG